VLTLAAVLLGAIAVTFAVGLSTSLNLVIADLSHDKAEQVQVNLPGGPDGAPGVKHGQIKVSPGNPGVQPINAAAQHEVVAAMRAQPGTMRYVGQADELVTVPGLPQQVALTAFFGNARWTGYALISGHWYTGPGQVLVPTHFLTVTGTRVGDTITFIAGGKLVTAKIVGQIFSTQNDGLSMVTDERTVASALPGLAPDRYDIALSRGTSAFSYAQSLQEKLGNSYFVMVNSRSSDVVSLMISLTATLTLLLAIVAGLGVLNTVVLHTRERVHDLGVFKAVGMTPRQTIAMVVCWVAGTGLVAGLIAVPAGVLLHRYILPAMAAGADVGVPPNVLNV
jgi:putative ABC transport system permease protein